MKSIRKLLSFLVAASLLVCGCSKSQQPASSGMVHFSVSVPETKMSFNPESEKAITTPRWEAGDQIAIYDGDTKVTVALKAENIINNGTAVEFSVSGLSTGSSTTYYVVYPASVAGKGTEEERFVDSDGVFFIYNYKLSAQNSKNSFFLAAKGTQKDGIVSLNPVYACANLYFTTAKSDISYVVMEVPSSSRALVTDYCFNPVNSKYSIGGETKNSIRYNLPSGSGTRSVNIALEPGTYAGGFTIKGYSSSGGLIHTYTSKNQSYTFNLGEYSFIQNFDGNKIN